MHASRNRGWRHRDPPRAVELAKKAVEPAPHGDIWNTLGVAQYRAGKWKLAIEALEKSMELYSGGDASDWFFLAMADWQLDHNDEARGLYKKAVERMDKNQPKNEELLRFRAEAEELRGISKPAPSTDAGTSPELYLFAATLFTTIARRARRPDGALFVSFVPS